MPSTQHWSLFLIGFAIALAGIVGVFLPPAHRWAVLLPIVAGAGVGIAGLALGIPAMEQATDGDTFWRIFFAASVAGFVTVSAGLAVIAMRAGSHGTPLDETL